MSPSLLTGDLYYSDEMAFWRTTVMILTYPAYGVRISQGNLAYTSRALACPLRNMVDAAAFYPGAECASISPKGRESPWLG